MKATDTLHSIDEENAGDVEARWSCGCVVAENYDERR